MALRNVKEVSKVRLKKAVPPGKEGLQVFFIDGKKVILHSMPDIDFLIEKLTYFKRDAVPEKWVTYINSVCNHVIFLLENLIKLTFITIML